MKRFKYSLDTVLDYKAQVLDNLKEEHAVILRDVSLKKEEIARLSNELSGFQEEFDSAKQRGASIESFRLYDICIGQMEKKIDFEKEVLSVLQQKEEKKKGEVITAKVDTSKFENLKSRRLREYQKAQAKEEEAFVEEFVVHNMALPGRQNRNRG